MSKKLSIAYEMRKLVRGDWMRKGLLIIGVLFCGFVMAACGKGKSSLQKTDTTTALLTERTDTPTDTESVPATELEKTPVAAEDKAVETNTPADSEKVEEKEMENKMKVKVGDYTFIATLEDNKAVTELVEMMKKAPVVLKLEDYSGFEKVGPLGKSLTRSDKQTTTEKGDIVLYSGSNIVLFYGSNSWSYTRLGKIDDLTDWEKALGKGNVTVTLSME